MPARSRRGGFLVAVVLLALSRPDVAQSKPVERETGPLDASGVANLAAKIQASENALRGEIQAVRKDFRAEIGKVRADFRAELGKAREDFRAEIGKAREDLGADLGAMQESLRGEIRQESRQVRDDLRHEIKLLREDMIVQFDRQSNLILGILASFSAMFIGTLGFAFWDRRSMTRPFEMRVAAIDVTLDEGRASHRAVVEVLRTIAEGDHRIASVLKKLRLL